MSNIARAYSVADIFQGFCNAYMDITPPASSLYPNADTHCLTLDANGQPTSATGSHLGSIEGPTNVTNTEKCNEIMDDQHEDAIDACIDSVAGEIDVIVKELTLTRMKSFMTSNVGTYTALANSQALQLGGNPDNALVPRTLLLVAPDRSAAGKFLYVLAFKCFLKSAIQLTFQRNKENTFKLKFGCVADLTRVAGDQVMQVVRTK